MHTTSHSKRHLQKKEEGSGRKIRKKSMRIWGARILSFPSDSGTRKTTAYSGAGKKGEKYQFNRGCRKDTAGLESRKIRNQPKGVERVPRQGGRPGGTKKQRKISLEMTLGQKSQWGGILEKVVALTITKFRKSHEKS